MQFIFKNLGPIHEATLELGDLTILAGRNNTGKTYKEINNLLMLGQEFKDKPKVLKKYKYSEHDFLKPESVRAYVAENNSLTQCPIEKYGIDMPVFDTTIDAINRVSHELEVRLTHEGEE